MSRPTPDDDVKVTLAALLHLVRLLSAELVAGKHREDVDLVEAAIRAKVNQIAVRGVSAEAVARGLAYAHELLGPVLSKVRAQASDVNAAKPLPERIQAEELTGSDRIPSILH